MQAHLHAVCISALQLERLQLCLDSELAGKQALDLFLELQACLSLRQQSAVQEALLEAPSIQPHFKQPGFQLLCVLLRRCPAWCTLPVSLATGKVVVFSAAPDLPLEYAPRLI